MASLRQTLPWIARHARAGARPLRSHPRSQTSRVLQRRGYATHGDHGHSKGFGEGPDWPWMVSSFGITGLASYWLLANDPLKDVDTSAHGHGHDAGHGESHGESEGDEKEAGEESEESSGGEGGEKGDDSSSENEGEQGKDTPASSDDESDEKPDKQEVKDEDGVRKSKGPTYEVRTGAKHRSEPHGDAEKSQKAEGVVETAKIKGVIDSRNRPAK